MFAKWSRQPIWLIVLFFAIAALIERQAPYYRSGSGSYVGAVAMPLSISQQASSDLGE